ncbi:tyrosine-type recombinase/integrase [Lacticaseibacillus jixianensis]|uniref:Tyrosine-type recombinase/integrase n=1 Tax=Lacticaseibacillus jixianensis TaxID=2486012 RepID=A0ABW4B559_9LACO|nr:tyrosine-type recombinase/integrase [Lacticaseibacillus jixianensis]
MVSYRKRGEVWQYEISYKDRDGQYKKLRRSGFRLKSDAELAASKVRTDFVDVRQYRNAELSLADFFERWLKLYKSGSVSDITLRKYTNTLKHIRQIFGDIKLKDLSRSLYQDRINYFAQTHAVRTVSTFHKQIRAALLDALDEHVIIFDPTRKTVITGKSVQPKRKALDYEDWQKLIHNLDSKDQDNLIIYIAAVTGMRYAEILGITPADLDLSSGLLRINKTWDYKYRTGFKKTKNRASIRTIPLDSKTTRILNDYILDHSVAQNTPLFLTDGVAPVSARINKVLTEKLNQLGLPRITFHGLRHTHASVLLYQGVSVLSVSKRLGHSNITTTQSTYLHIIKELEEQDNDKIINILNTL